MYRPKVDADVAYRLHRLAIDSPDDARVARGYARQDKALRRGAQDDRTWFDRRFSLGEEASMTEASRVLAQELDGLGWPLPKGWGDTTVQRTPALRVVDVSVDSQHVATGGRAPAELVMVGLHGARYRELVEAQDDLSEADRTLLELHLGATFLVQTQPPRVDIDQLMTTAGRALLPLRGEEEAGRVFLQRLGDTCLDQPPGEIARIASGFHSGRTDRLHRAWERGFFVPRGAKLIAPDP